MPQRAVHLYLWRPTAKIGSAQDQVHEREPRSLSALTPVVVTHHSKGPKSLTALALNITGKGGLLERIQSVLSWTRGEFYPINARGLRCHGVAPSSRYIVTLRTPHSRCPVVGMHALSPVTLIRLVYGKSPPPPSCNRWLEGLSMGVRIPGPQYLRTLAVSIISAGRGEREFTAPPGTSWFLPPV